MTEGRLVLMFGPPGSGKSTQGQHLARDMGWDWVSAGKVLKEFCSQELRDRLDRGELAKDEEINPIMDKVVAERTAGGQILVLDGYPRNFLQAEYLLNNWPKVLVVVELNITEEEAYRRITERNRDEGDSVEATKKRLDIFNQNIVPIKKVLEAGDIAWVRVDGKGSVDEVHDRIMAGIKNVLK